MWHRLIADPGVGGRNLIEKSLNYFRNVFLKPDKKPCRLSHSVADQIERNAFKIANFLSGRSKRAILQGNISERLVSKMKTKYSSQHNRIYQKSISGVKIGKLSTLVVSYGFFGIALKQSTTEDIFKTNLKEDNCCLSSLNNNNNDRFGDDNSDFDVLDSNEENELNITSNISSDIEVLNCLETNEELKCSNVEITMALISKLGSEEKQELLQFLLQSSDQNASESYDDSLLVGENIQMCNMLMMSMKRMQSIVYKQQKVINMITNRFERMLRGPTATELQVLSYEMILNEGDEQLGEDFAAMPIFIN